jgi:hypothetical protein
MLQCLDGVKHLCGVLLKCCDIDLKQPKGLEDPEVLARETVCTCSHGRGGCAGCGEEGARRCRVACGGPVEGKPRGRKKGKLTC